MFRCTRGEPNYNHGFKGWVVNKHVPRPWRSPSCAWRAEGLCGSKFSMTNIFHGAASTHVFFFAPLLVDIFDSISLIGQYYWSLPALWTRDFYLPAPLLLMPRYWRLRPERPNSPQGQWPPEPCTSISWGWLRGRGDLLSTHSQ